MFICRGFDCAADNRYAECADVSDELMTLLLSTDGTLSVNCLIKETEDTISNHTVAMDVAVPSAVAVADLPSSPSILPMSDYYYYYYFNE